MSAHMQEKMNWQTPTNKIVNQGSSSDVRFTEYYCCLHFYIESGYHSPPLLGKNFP